MANGLPINKETFRNLNSFDSKLDAVFDVLEYMHESGYESKKDREEFRQNCAKRFSVIEKRKTREKGFAGAMGFIGGFVAQVLNKNIF